MGPNEGTVTQEDDGETFIGHFWVKNGIITVTTFYAIKSAHVGTFAPNPEVLAKILLSEIVEGERLKRGK